MPNGERAPVWFLNTFIKERFSQTAKLRKYDIEVLNNAVRKALEKQQIDEEPGSCSRCARQFSSKAKPTKCPSCSQYFHRTCIPPHSSTCALSSSSPSLAASPHSMISAFPTPGSQPVSQRQPSKRARTSSVSCVASVSLTSAPRFSTVCSILPDGTSPSPTCTTTSLTTVSSIVSPSMSSYITESLPSCAFSMNVASTTTSSTQSVPVSNISTRKKTKANAPQLSPEAAKINFLNLELNAAQTRIVNLETTVNDRDVTIKIQKEKIKALEQTQAEFVNHKHSTYSHSNVPKAHQSIHPHPSSGCTPCYQVPIPYLPCHDHARHHHQLQGPHAHPGDAEVTSSVHLEILQEIKVHLQGIQDSIGMIAAHGPASLINVTTSKTDESESNKHVEAPIPPNDPGGTETDENRADHIDIVNVEVVNVDNDDSIASADELVPEIQLPTQHNLNYLV